MSTSSFTPINRPGADRTTPPPSVAPQVISHTHTVDGLQPCRKRHNPVVARYLGLGTRPEPAHLEKYAPVLPSPTTPPRGVKRGLNCQEDTHVSKAKKQKPTRVSGSLPATIKSCKKRTQAVQEGQPDIVLVSSPPIAKNGGDLSADAAEIQEHAHRLTAVGEHCDHKLNSSGPTALMDIRAPRHALNAGHAAYPRTTAANRSGQDTMVDDEFGDFDNIFDSIDPDNVAGGFATNSPQSQMQSPIDTSSPKYNSSRVYAVADRPSTFGLTDDCSSPVQGSWVDREIRPGQYPGDTNAATVVRPDNNSDPTHRLTLSVMSMHGAAHDKVATDVVTRKPIVRSPFPVSVRDHSPIIGLSSNLLLRTCFRVGEAINQACHAAQHGENIMYELYARVLSSTRNEAKQQFIFSDLFHDKPPHLKGEYDAAIWKQVELYNYDSGRFLAKKRMCRCIGKMKREGKNWVLVVFNIWQATWEDIEWVEGIICP